MLIYLNLFSYPLIFAPKVPSPFSVDNLLNAVGLNFVTSHSDKLSYSSCVELAKISIISRYRLAPPMSSGGQAFLPDELMNDFVLQGRLKELVVEWLRNREEWSGMFDQPISTQVPFASREVI